MGTAFADPSVHACKHTRVPGVHFLGCCTFALTAGRSGACGEAWALTRWRAAQTPDGDFRPRDVFLSSRFVSVFSRHGTCVTWYC